MRRALGEVEAVAAGATSRDDATARVVAVVEDFGLRPVEPPPLPAKIEVDDLGVVCWTGVLPA